jgi:RNA polymerase sigma-70 factor, ECF subfamily
MMLVVLSLRSWHRGRPVRVNAGAGGNVSFQMIADSHESEDDDHLATLAVGAAGGDASAFAVLASSVRARVVAWAGAITGNRDDAEDVAQLVLLRLRDHVHRFEGRSRFTSWLFQVTRNVTLSSMQRERRQQALLAAQDPGIVGPAAAGAGESADPHGIEMLVQACFTDLTDRQREVFEWIDLRGVSAPEVARRLGIAPATVRVLLMKARRTIRLRLLEQHADLLEEYDR